ncbi:hypothetical protein HNY73_004463 [Argiope bruennichi]|uniref:Uncharacterized protein n=1 Tax=Argiope bruennichi TaxID=94029 RepID=A0A8T0FP19_ARGBR|nr:hypothetical protein HNY73_004463 [Argiope bruennichi]
MSYTVEWTKASQRDYDCLELVHQRVVDTCIEEMETDPFRGDKKLNHCPLADWRKRAGQHYRVLFDVIESLVILKRVPQKMMLFFDHSFFIFRSVHMSFFLPCELFDTLNNKLRSTMEWTKAAKDYDRLELVHQRTVDACVEEMEQIPFRGAKLHYCPLSNCRKLAGKHYLIYLNL